MTRKAIARNFMCGAAAFAVAACGGGDDTPPTAVTPTPSPTPSPTPTPTPTPSPTSSTVIITSDIQYGEGATASGDIPLFLDLYAPDESCSANRPTVVFVHGGGFVGGNKSSDNVTSIAEEMTARSINVVSIQYRLDPQDPIPGSVYQDILDQGVADGTIDPNADRLDAIFSAFEDTVLALNFLQDNQNELCIDTDKIAYWGSSAGAYTVLTVGYGLNQFGIERPAPSVVIDYWGGLFGDENLELGEAPFLVLHGTADGTVDYQEAIDLTNAADVVAVPFALYTVNGAGHGFGATGTFTNTVDGQTLFVRTADFVEAHLTDGTPIYGRFDLNP
ncbi:MAG: alpha/beta hydrolase fold domain-containing protein [Erythrobacter sp.]